MIKLHKIVAFVLLVISLYCFLGLHVLMREAAMLAKAMYQDTEGCLAKKSASPGGPQANNFRRR